MYTQKNSVKRSLITSATALVLSIAMLIGTTFAWFTDSVTSGRNKIVAGNLDGELEYAKPSDVENGAISDDKWKEVKADTELFSALEDDNTTKNLWEPGHTEVVYLKIHNAGTLALDYKLSMSKINEIGAYSVTDGEAFKLSDHLVFKNVDGNEAPTVYTSREEAWDTNDNKGWNLYEKEEEALKSGETRYVTMVVYMPTTVGNEANYDSTKSGAPEIEFGVELLASQAEYEKDSFGTDYDKDDQATGKWDIPTYVENEDITYPVSVEKEVVSGGNTVLTSTVNNTLVAEVTVPSDAVAENTSKLALKIDYTDVDSDFSFETGTTVTAFDIHVTGIKENNANDISVKMFLGTGLKNVSLKHKTATGVEDISVEYDSGSGYVIFKTKSFSDYAFGYNQAIVASIGNEAYPTLESAFAAAKDGDTITLLEDAVVAQKITIDGGKNIVLDLNNHNVVSNTYYVFYIINANFRITGNGSVIENIKDGYAPIFAKGSSTDIANYTVVSIDKDVTLKGDYSGIFIDGKPDSYFNYGLVINLSGSIDMSSITDGVHESGIYINGNSKVTTGNVPQINLNGSTISGCKTGIYAAGYADWNVTNSNITGINSAIEIRAGKLNIEGGVYTATATNYSCTANGSGSTVQGAAIVVAQHTTKLPLTVDIHNGSFSGVKSLVCENPQSNSDNDLEKVLMTVSGGIFNSEVSSVLNTKFISGGNFSTDPSKYVLEGYQATENNGTWTVTKAA